VARDDSVRIEGGDGADASDPRLARGRVGESGQHVHLVADHVTGGDGPQRRDVHDRRVLDVALTDVDHAQLVAVEIDRVPVEQFRLHRDIGDLAAEQAAPVGPHPFVGRLEPSAGEHVPRREATGLRKALLQPGEPDPVVRIPVCDRDADDCLPNRSTQSASRSTWS